MDRRHFIKLSATAVPALAVGLVVGTSEITPQSRSLQSDHFSIRDKAGDGWLFVIDNGKIVIRNDAIAVGDI